MTKNLQTIKTTLLVFALSFFSVVAFAQENRTYDGTGNNLQHSEWGAFGTNQLRITEASYADGVSEPAGFERPNPRHISNTIFNQDGLLEDALTISDYAFVWGQFIDHDITLVGDNHSDPLPISVPSGDPYFDPFSSGDVQIPLMRSSYDETTGTSPENPREFPNIVSAFIDASMVYGSTEERADWLRTFQNGKLKMSAGNLLPYNTTTGEAGSPVDPNTPMMAMANPYFTRWFVAGDVRANEKLYGGVT